MFRIYSCVKQMVTIEKIAFFIDYFGMQFFRHQLSADIALRVKVDYTDFKSLISQPQRLIKVDCSFTYTTLLIGMSYNNR